MNPPQAKTLRYVRILLAYGENSDFILTSLDHEESKVDDEVVGHYYRAMILSKPTITGHISFGIGKTPQVALRNALIKAGVTFR